MIHKNKTPTKDKSCINYRLLQYPLSCFDYTKKNNKAYTNMYYSRLLANYIWFKFKNIDFVTKCLLKHSKQRIFNIIRKDLKFLIPEYEREYQLDFNSADIHRILKFDKTPRLCLKCSKRVLINNTFCSVKCSNNYKLMNEQYRENLSKGVSEWYKTADKNKLKTRHTKIKKTVNNFISGLTIDERREKYTNKSIEYTSFDSRQSEYQHVTFLFDREFYYNNKYLPVKCNTCGFEWSMTKTTGICRTVCVKCNPLKKGKTQSEIAEFISVPYKLNDKSFLDSRKELDILCLQSNFAIEYNGLLYHSFGESKYAIFNNTAIDSKYHLRKTEEAELKGIQLFHIFENEWIFKKDIWKSIINNKIGLSEKIYARECIIKEIDYSDSSVFLNNNHMQGNCNSSIKIGLYYNNELVSVMTFRKHRKYDWEIARFANKINNSVIGGASKLLKYFERKYQPKSILSYANRRWSCGNLYEALGFDFIENTPPNYFYFKVNENTLYPREMFQKHNLKSILKIYDENLSEVSNMFRNEYRIIYDSGNKKYIKFY